MTPTTVLHLVGSAIDDFHADLSRLYARGCLEALADPARFDTHIALVSPDGSWQFPRELTATAIERAERYSLAESVTHIANSNVDVVIPQMFCLPGMTAYRALFDVLGIPYVGNRPDVMAVGADKAKARAIVSAAGVEVPGGRVVRAGEGYDPILPVVVKPVAADNSVGVALARTQSQYEAALESALAHGGAALVESYVELGREVRCGIVVHQGELICLPLEEYAVHPDTRPIRTREDKLARTEDGELFLVAKDAAKAWIVSDDDVLTERVWDAARRCHVAMGCRHYSLFDFRIDPDGRPWFLEAGLYCSFSPSSVIAVMAAANGLDVCALFAMALDELKLREPCSISQR